MKSLLLLAVALPAFGQVGITLQSADQALIPGSVRSLYASVHGSDNLEVRWTVTGGCTLAAPITHASPQTVTAPAQGASCKLASHPATNESPSFSSSVSCRVTATSAADPNQSASIVLPVCSPHIQLNVFPATTVLYKNQFAVIQSDLRGSVDTAVTWTLTSNPGGAGALAGGATNRHAVFSASAPGTYVLSATSNADPHKKASSVLYVTPHDLPPPSADHTEPVDCTAVGKGKTFDVGPARPLHDLNAVPWSSLRAGDTVRIHNDDTTGKEPSTYHQHVSLSGTGGPGQPIRICGVPDDHGVKPILDADNASSPKDNEWAGGWLEDVGVVSLYDGPHKFDAEPDNNRNLLIEGLHLRNATPAFHFLRQKDGAPVPFGRNSACIHVHTGREVMLRGNELENCSQGIFVNSQTPQGSVVLDLTVEGNYIHHWGIRNSYLVHGMYLQAIGLAVQFNYFGPASDGAIGNMIKSRSVLNFLRWNYISQPQKGTARAFDLVEPQSYDCYVNPHTFAIYHSPANNDCNTPHGGVDNDPFSPDQLAANFEAYHSDYVYGNIMDDSGSGAAFVHYGYDQQTEQGPKFNRRGGTLFYWDNTHLVRSAQGLKSIFDTAAPDTGHSYEFPTVESLNNVFAAQGETLYQWVKPLWSRIVVDSNWMKPDSVLPNRDSLDSYQGGLSSAERSTCGAYERCQQSNGHMEWKRGGKPGTEAQTLYVGPLPFDERTFEPSDKLRGLAAPLPRPIQDQPSNLEFFPASGKIALRRDFTFLGALD